MYNGLHFCFLFYINETNIARRINGEYYWGCLHQRYFACNDHIYLFSNGVYKWSSISGYFELMI